MEGRNMKAPPNIEAIIKSKFAVLRFFGEKIESFLDSELETLRNKSLKLLEEKSTSLANEFWNDLFPNYLALEFNFPNILRASLFNSAYFLFEDSLQRICMILAAKRSLCLRINDLRGSGIHRSRLYLAKVAGVAFPDPDDLWEDINQIRLLRNCLVHNDGWLREADKSLGEFVRGNKSLSLDPGDRINFDQVFVTRSLNKLESYLLFLTAFVDETERA